MENRKHIVNGKPMVFEERSFFDGRIAMCLPDHFEELPPQKVREIYPLVNIPDMVLGDVQMDLFVGFRYTEHEIADESIEEFLKIVRMMLEQTGARMEILAEREAIKEGHTIASLDLLSRASAEAIYHKLFFCSLKGRILMGFINFPSTRGYHGIMEEIFRSFRFTEN